MLLADGALDDFDPDALLEGLVDAELVALGVGELLKLIVDAPGIGATAVALAP